MSMCSEQTRYVRLVSSGFLLAIFLLASKPLEAFDTFWQLQSGRYIWQTGAFLYLDTFSLAAEVARLEHCWLHDLILYALQSLGGWTPLVLLKSLLITLCGGVLLLWSRRKHVTIGLAVPILLLCLLASQDSWLARPQLWTFLLSILYLWLLFAGRENGWRSWLWLVPLMLAWANLHAGCVFGFALVGAFAAGEAVRCLQQRAKWRDWWVLIGCLGLVFLAAFVNPYGYRIPLGVLASHLDQSQVAAGTASIFLLGNMEWLPPTLDQAPLFFVVMGLWGALILLRWRQSDPAEIILFLGFCYMGFSQIRHTTLVALLAGFFLPAAAQQFTHAIRPGLLSRPLSNRLLLSLSLVLIIALPTRALIAGELGLGLKAGQYPVAAADFIREQKLPANLYNAYDWGGYLMWRLYPDYLVYVDGRSDSEEYFAASTRIENSLTGWQNDLRRHGVKTIITRTCFYDTGGPLDLINALSRASDWELVYQDDVALVYLRAGEAARLGLPVLPKNRAFATMLSEATRLQQDAFPRPRVNLALARAHLAAGDFQAARESYARHVEVEPAHREAVMMLQQLKGF